MNYVKQLNVASSAYIARLIQETITENVLTVAMYIASYKNFQYMLQTKKIYSREVLQFFCDETNMYNYELCIISANIKFALFFRCPLRHFFAASNLSTTFSNLFIKISKMEFVEIHASENFNY